MLLTIEEARATLRVDGEANDCIIMPLLEALPAYINTLTGCEQLGEAPDDLAKTLAKFILQLWYNPDGTDADRLQRVIDSLAKTIKAREVKLKQNQ